jgi:ABC-2 type transport system permease protein
MQGKYNQLRAMFAITKASLKATFRTPSSVFFGLAFPLVFIFVFGSIGSSSGVTIDIGIAKGADTTTKFYKIITNYKALTVVNKPDSELTTALKNGDITAIINITKDTGGDSLYSVQLTSSNAVSPTNLQILQAILNGIAISIEGVNFKTVKINPHVTPLNGKAYKYIDFLLPGMLGFSLLGGGVFGVAFLFFNLRQQLVLKRFFSTPVSKPYIVMAEALSRVIFNIITAVVIILVGILVYHFTLVNGFATLVQMMALCIIGLLVFMGFGFIVTNVAKNENVIPIFANFFTLPQLLLAGTFFPVSTFPKWMQVFCNQLPLTHFNNAMRKISFEGATLINTWQDVGALLIWGVVLYGIAIRVFKWE